MCLFNPKTISEEEVVGYFYEPMVYTNLIEELRKRKRYGNGAIQVSTETLRECANTVPENVMEKKGALHIKCGQSLYCFLRLSKA